MICVWGGGEGGREREREKEILISFPENFNYNTYKPMRTNRKKLKVVKIDMWGRYKYLPQS